MAFSFVDPNSISAIAASVSALIAALALIGVSLQVYFLVRQLRQDLNWKQREKALLFSPVYHPEVQEALLKISGKLESLHRQDRKATVSLKELDDLIAQDKTTKDHIELVLVYLESIGLAVEHNVADFEIVYASLGTQIIRFCETFSEYIKRAQRNNPRAWEHIDCLKGRSLQERDRLRNIPIPTRRI